jgi:ribosomal protein L11 methyltransferase
LCKYCFKVEKGHIEMELVVMKWSEIAIHTTNEAVEPISNILHEAGASGVVIEDPYELEKEREDRFGEIYQLNPDDYPEEGVIVKAYLPVNSFLGETVDEIKEAINGLILHNIDIGRNTVTISEVNEEEWATAWKKYYHPVKISKKFTIVPTWEEYTPVSSDELIIELDPGMAFGTGTHPTTVMCIQALERTVQPGDQVIDVGTGSGVLSIAAGLLGAARIQALDLDEVAVNSARINIKLNKVNDRATVSQNNLLDGINETVDIVVANILAEVIVRFTNDAARIVKPGGYFITSGIILQKKQEVKDAIVSAGFEIEETIQMEDWVAFIAKRQ